MARQPLLNFLPSVFSLLSFVLILFVILGGVHNALSQIYYLKTDTTNLSIPSKLANSTFLKDLSTVSGADYVGQPSTTSSLGLATSYTIGLLTSCGHFADGSVSCSPPSIGSSFNPGSDLRLDSTSLQQGSYSQDLLNALSTYSKVSRFLAGAYIVSALLVFAAPLAACCSAVLAAVLSTLATVLLLATSIAGVLVFKSVNSAFNANFNNSGLSSSLGTIPAALSFVAFVFSLLVAVVFIIRARDPDAGCRRRGPILARSVGGKAGDGTVLGEDPYSGPGGGDKKPGLWGRVPTWNRHKYVQVEKQPAIVRTNVVGHQEAVAVDGPADDARRRLDDDWAVHDDEYSHGGSNIPLVALGGNKKTKDVNTAYEPYSGTTD
ncbi:putative integral membrane protein [Diplogelasinospora grovesii]|uniref:Integral membrane protein n=1 Tax=Diplogelasinospora grovesii TaxID=303347 RepID=A0AAN6N067_9PEZI|nr:putative integral membrane protein [Diplogelasinospora grovesii]